MAKAVSHFQFYRFGAGLVPEESPLTVCPREESQTFHFGEAVAQLRDVPAENISADASRVLWTSPESGLSAWAWLPLLVAAASPLGVLPGRDSVVFPRGTAARRSMSKAKADSHFPIFPF